jgi:hypothetical protein
MPRVQQVVQVRLSRDVAQCDWLVRARQHQKNIFLCQRSAETQLAHRGNSVPLGELVAEKDQAAGVATRFQDNLHVISRELDHLQVRLHQVHGASVIEKEVGEEQRRAVGFRHHIERLVRQRGDQANLLELISIVLGERRESGQQTWGKRFPSQVHDLLQLIDHDEAKLAWVHLVEV